MVEQTCCPGAIQLRDRFFCRRHTVPTGFLDHGQEHPTGSGCPVSCMAQDHPVHIPAGGADTAHPRQGVPRGSVSDSLLASKEMIHRHHDTAVWDTVTSSHLQGLAVQGRRADSAHGSTH